MTRARIWEAFALLLALTVIVLATAGLFGEAHSTELPWPHSQWVHDQRVHRAEHKKAIKVIRERDMQWHDDRDEREDVECRGPVRGLGTQWIGKEGALDAAKKDWMERVRYDHGESFLDMGNARDAVVRCGRVSIGETLNQVMYRCEIVARPCHGTPRSTQLETK